MKRGANIVGRMDDTTRRTVRWDGWDDRPTDRPTDYGREGGREGGRRCRSLAGSLTRSLDLPRKCGRRRPHKSQRESPSPPSLLWPARLTMMERPNWI